MASARVAATTTDAAVESAAVGQLGSYLRLYERHLRAANRADATIHKYLLSARQLIDFLTASGMPTIATTGHREHVEAFMAASLEQTKASTAATRYQALRVFFNFLVDEGEIAESPMRRMKPPIVPEERTAEQYGSNCSSLVASDAVENRATISA